MIANHSGLPKFVSHLYGAESFSNYANHYITRSTPALTVFSPNIFTAQITPPDKHEGDYFVFPKNYDDTSEALTSWKLNLPEDIYHMLLDTTEAIKEEFNDGNTIGHHAIIDRHLTPFCFDVLMDHFKTDDGLLLRHHIHAICDKFYRNYAAERVLLDLADVRIKIFGRGWERFKSKRNPNHEFFPFDKAVDGNSQFCSNYGILDVPPSNDSLHDRTLRAVANRGGFLLASSWNHEKYLSRDFSSLFYAGQSHQLRERVEQVMQDPEKHRRLATEFGQSYEKVYSFKNFLNDLENIARTQKNSVH
mgnify:CR=1 FL=1